MKKPKPPKPEKGSPVYSKAARRAAEPKPEPPKSAEHGQRCACLYCRSQRGRR